MITFSLRHTFESAQPLTFYADFNQASNTLVYPQGSLLVSVTQSGSDEKGSLHVSGGRRGYVTSEVRRRFRLRDDMGKIYKKIRTDAYIAKAIDLYRGMRLTLNDPWETTLVFIISQFNNVKRIRLITRSIIAKYGSEIEGRGAASARSFPTSADMTKATEKELKRLGAGYRARYIIGAADYCTNNVDLGKLPSHKYLKLKEELMQIDGVGEKVADCIALMGYGNLKAFPIDVHIKRTMEKLYFEGKVKRIREIRDFAESRWGDYMGYAQQYLFHKARMMA